MKRILISGCLFLVLVLAFAFSTPRQASGELANKGNAAAAQAGTTSQPGVKSEQPAEPQQAKPAIIPVIALDRPLTESPTVDDPFFGSLGAESLKSLVERLEKARQDEQVKGVVVLLGQAGMGAAQTEEVYGALRALRDAGKPVYVHADSLSFGKLALASSGTRISVAPVGDLFITGMYGAQPHIRGMLEKIHVTPDFITCGKYKSAGEMFMRTEPSPEAERMYDWLFDSMFDTYVGLIADGRERTRDDVRKWVDQGLYSAERAAELGIIDAAEYKADMLSLVKQEHGENIKLDKKYAQRKANVLDFSSPFTLFKIWGEILRGGNKQSTKPAVAVVYVEGGIVPGKPDPSPFGSDGMAYSDPIRKALDTAAERDSIKAVVLRVDSPGGSAVASEIILQATKRVAAKKPLIVSMGNVAGSGGYYVSCGAETIYADASTITASIGVVAGKLATREMWDSIGVAWHPIARGKNSSMLHSRDVFTDEQRDNLQAWMNEVYEVFKNHVVAIRGDRLAKPIDAIAGGRVFTGRQALELGLVDRLGTLNDAVKDAAKRARLEDYEVRVIPRPKSFIELLMSDATGQDDEDQQLSLHRTVSSGQASILWKAVVPALQQLEPQQTAALKRVLMQLQILQRERVSLTMPVIATGF